jgi:hypothetical protein
LHESFSTSVYFNRLHKRLLETFTLKRLWQKNICQPYS